MTSKEISNKRKKERKKGLITSKERNIKQKKERKRKKKERMKERIE